jgi:methyl-accepting chemotaxis protein
MAWKFALGAPARLAALYSSMAAIEFRMDGTIVSANGTFLKVMGYNRGEVVGRHHSMFVDPAERSSPEYRAFWQTLNRGEASVAQFRRIAKDGREIWLEASYNPIRGRGGKPVGVLKLATDITGQKTRHAELLGKIDAISRSQAVIEFALDGTILDANENFLSVMGYRLDEIVGQHHSMFVDAAVSAGADYAAFWERLREGRFQAAQFKRLAKGGRTIWIEASYNPIFDANGRPVKIVKFATDITSRKEQNAALAQEFEATVKTTVEAVASSAVTMRKTAQVLATVAGQTSEQSGAASAATEQLGVSVSEIARQMEHATRATGEAMSEARQSETMVGQLLGAAEKIGAVSQLIASIANQTNMLALNATIEAARAGDAGKGFAVVASEVKSLATQTARATGEIEQQVRGVQESSQATASAIRLITSAVSQVSEIGMSVSGAVEQQEAATREVSHNVVEVSRAAEEAGKSSSELLGIAHSISQQAVDLTSRVDSFLESVLAM